MAGDWIKMRDNLWDDPRVAKIVDLTDSSEAAVVGSLYWLWAAADQHTEDGVMLGLTLRGIDRKTGVKGFAEALCVVGWLADHPDGVRIVDFERHNGSSAKKRCQTAKRVASHGAANATTKQKQSATESKVTQDGDLTNAHRVSSALAREREEKEKEEEERHAVENLEDHAPETGLRVSRQGAICMVIKAEGIASVNPQHPDLLALIEQGADVGHFASAAKTASEKGKGFAYVLGVVKGQIADAKGIAGRAGVAVMATSTTARPAALSFAERDRIAAMQRWEESTNQRHPDLPPEFSKFQAPSQVIDVTPSELRISQ